MYSCFLIVVVGWVFSVCLHEYGHAKVAFHGGDHSVEEKGYLSMNPIHYAHPVMSFVLPVIFMIMGGIGLPGGAVYIERQNLRSRWWETWVSLAGPGMNLLLVIILTLLLRLVFIPRMPDHTATHALAFLLELEIWAILINLLPIPPLDGFQALGPWIPVELEARLMQASNYTLFILFILLMQFEPLNRAIGLVLYFVFQALGVDPGFANQGYHEFRFWEH